MKKSTILTITFTLSCLAVIFFYSLFVPLVTQEAGFIYDLPAGTSKQKLTVELSQQGVVTHPWLFALCGYLFSSPYLKVGEYQFPKGSTTFSIWRQITTGRGFALHPLMIVPGWTFTQIRQAVNQATGLTPTINKMDDKQIMQALGRPKLSPEGLFFPETYYYTKGITDERMLKRALELMQRKLFYAWVNRDPGLPYETMYQALIAASLIEKEAYLNAERPVVASVIVNRLRKDMLLQVDATVIYGLGAGYKGKIMKSDLTTDTPYNTYVHKGLPPTPIAAPSMASIEAALHPIQSDYYYYVAKGDGSHQFSRNLTEHNVAVANAKKHTQSVNSGKGT